MSQIVVPMRIFLRICCKNQTVPIYLGFPLARSTLSHCLPLLDFLGSTTSSPMLTFYEWCQAACRLRHFRHLLPCQCIDAAWNFTTIFSVGQLPLFTMCAIAAMHCGVWVPEGPAGYTSQFLHVSMAISVDHGLSGVSWISSGAVGFLSRNQINLPYPTGGVGCCNDSSGGHG